VIIKFGGDFYVAREREAVFHFLADPLKFAPLLPDFENVRAEDSSHFVVSLRVGVAHIRGTAVVKLALKESQPFQRAVYEGSGDVPGGTAALTAYFDLEDSEEGTKVIWAGEARIVGRLPSLAGGLLEPLARKNVQKLIDALQAALAQTPKSAGSSGGKEGSS
jgi:carbon monoxide dehydrogenase subunit G